MTSCMIGSQVATYELKTRRISGYRRSDAADDFALLGLAHVGEEGIIGAVEVRLDGVRVDGGAPVDVFLVVIRRHCGGSRLLSLGTRA